MRIKIKLSPLQEPSPIPAHYNHLLQSFIYRNLSPRVSEKLHQSGFSFGKRQFRLFVFSKIFGSFKREGENLLYKGDIFFWVASPLVEILESFASGILRHKLKLGSSHYQILSVEVGFDKPFPGNILIKTLSPITSYSTVFTSDQKRKTYYFSPFEKDFSRICGDNLLKKYKILKGRSFHIPGGFSLTPEKVSKKNEHIIMYKGTVIKAWSGIYRLEAPPELMEIAFDCGLGAKNSQGFGMIERYTPLKKKSNF